MKNFTWEFSQFDSEILGFKTAKITHVNPTNLNKSIRDLKNDLIKNGIEYATHRIAASDYLLAQNLEKNRFILVDGIISLETKITEIDPKKSTFILEAKKEDVGQLANISKKVFMGISRYYHDLIISEKKADSVYEEWIKNSLNKKVADMVLVWKNNDDVLGFITLKKNGEIPLVGVSEEARGKGVGRDLVLSALEVFKKWGLKKVLIETQITNTAALRLYHSCGFKIIDSYLTFRWSSLG